MQKYITYSTPLTFKPGGGRYYTARTLEKKFCYFDEKQKTYFLDNQQLKVYPTYRHHSAQREGKAKTNNSKTISGGTRSMNSFAGMSSFDAALS